jgi:gp6-like head-tail connector protein
MHSIVEILQETSDSAGPDLISLDDLKLALGINDNSEDAQLQAAITFQSRIIAEYCNRRFGRAQVLETFTFDHYEDMLQRQALTLSVYPVAEIFEVSTAGATAADFEFDSASGRLWIPNCPYGYGGFVIAVTYSGGYDLPEEAPARLQRAVIETVNGVRMQSAFGVRDPSIREVQHGDTRISYVSQSFAAGTTGQHLTPSVTDLINPFRRMYIA